MSSTTPLLIVGGTVAVLLLVQQLLARVGERRQAAAETGPREQGPQGRPLAKGLTVTGLDERGVNSLRALIKAAETTDLATFLAFNHPRIIELEGYLLRLHEQFGQSPDAITADRLPPAPASLRIDELSPTDRNLLINRDPRQTRLIDRAFMARFGGHAFLPHFALYSSRESGVTLHVPPFDPDRQLFETLAKSGIASRGRQIPLQQRLTVLKMQELRQMGKDLKLKQKFTRKADATEALSQVPGSAVLLSMQYVIDDLFMLNPLDVDPNAIKQEWAWLMACSRLLATLPARRAPVTGETSGKAAPDTGKPDGD